MHRRARALGAGRHRHRGAQRPSQEVRGCCPPPHFCVRCWSIRRRSASCVGMRHGRMRILQEEGGVLLVNAQAPLGYAVITAQTPSYLTARYDTSRKTGCTPLEFACMQVSPTVPSSWVTTCALCAPNTTVSQRTLGAATQPDSRSRNAQVKLAGLFALYTDNTIEQKAALVHALQALPAVGGGARVGRMRAQVQVLN